MKYETTNDYEHRRMLIIPSLIERPIENFCNGKSEKDIHDKYEMKFEKELSYEFGKNNCFISSGLSSIFLVQLFNVTEMSLSVLLDARSYMSRRERRKPGFVFAMEFHSKDEGDISIFEEERIDDDASVYNTRWLRVYSKGSDKFKNITISAMKKACEIIGVPIPPEKVSP